MIEAIALPVSVDVATLVLLTMSSVATSFITAAFGIGGGGLLLAIMATLVPPSALIPVHGVVQLGSNAGRMALFLRHVHWPALPGFALGSILGSIVGGLIVVELSAAVVQIGVGAFVIFTVLVHAPAWFGRTPAIAGAISSFLTMFFGATGLFVASFTKALSLPRLEHVATHATLMTLQHGLKVGVFALLGFAFAEWGAVVVAMILAGGVGTVLGRSMLIRIEDLWFRRGLDLLLILISARLIWAGATGL